MATFHQVILTALTEGKMKMLSVNQHMVELSKETKRKAGFAKVNITDELVSGLMNRTRVAFILHMDADEMNALSLSIDSNEPPSEAEAEPQII